MSCIRSCYEKDSPNFGHEDCGTCIHGDRPPQQKQEPDLGGVQVFFPVEQAQKQEPLCTAAMLDEWFLAKSGLSPDTKLYTSPPQRQPLTDEQEREAFEDYAVRTICNPVELQRKRLSGYGSEELNYLWRGWKARAAHGIKGEA